MMGAVAFQMLSTPAVNFYFRLALNKGRERIRLCGYTKPRYTAAILLRWSEE